MTSIIMILTYILNIISLIFLLDSQYQDFNIPFKLVKQIKNYHNYEKNYANNIL